MNRSKLEVVEVPKEVIDELEVGAPWELRLVDADGTWDTLGYYDFLEDAQHAASEEAKLYPGIDISVLELVS